MANKGNADKVLERTEHLGWLLTPTGSMGNKQTQNKTARGLKGNKKGVFFPVHSPK